MATGFASNKFYCPCRQRKVLYSRDPGKFKPPINRTSFQIQSVHPGLSAGNIFINREARLQNINNKHTENCRASVRVHLFKN